MAMTILRKVLRNFVRTMGFIGLIAIMTGASDSVGKSDVGLMNQRPSRTETQNPLQNKSILGCTPLYRLRTGPEWSSREIVYLCDIPITFSTYKS